MKPNDWVMQVSASRSYLQKWNYGASFKFISSNYGIYRSNGIAMDFGVLYTDTANLFSVSLLAKNMGYQLKKYAGTEADELPFDLQAGITKKLKHAPWLFHLLHIICTSLISVIMIRCLTMKIILGQIRMVNLLLIRFSGILFLQHKFSRCPNLK